jgi:hypothetical protein
MKKFQAYLLIAVVAIFCLASGTVAQTVQGVITGTITDPSGASVPNATVMITNVGTGATQTATTSSDGSYRFSLVPPGSYVLDVKAQSFAEFRASGVVVQASQTIPLSVALELAKGSEVIEVTEQNVLVQTATSDLSTQIDRETILNAPLADRDVFSTLPFLAPSVTPGMNLNPASGGARESGTAYMALMTTTTSVRERSTSIPTRVRRRLPIMTGGAPNTAAQPAPWSAPTRSPVPTSFTARLLNSIATLR